MELAREFHLSCQNNNLEKLRDCLARGVDVNLVDRNWSGLNIAAFYGHRETLDVLLSYPDIKIISSVFGTLSNSNVKVKQL